MSAFRLSEKAIDYNRSDWWLRNVVSSTFFAHMSSAGYVRSYSASNVYGVRPFALLR